MKQKTMIYYRLMGTILVLVTLLLMTGGVLAAPRSAVSTISIPNLNPDFGSYAVQSCLIGKVVKPGEFTKQTSSPVFSPGTPGNWDDTTVFSPSVLWYNNEYKMWYTGSNSAFISGIGYATSPDGEIWTRSGKNPVLTKGGSESWENNSVAFGSVIPDGGGFKMWYTGFGSGGRKVGLATSIDGISWSKYAGNPVLEVSPSGNWDSSQVTNPTVIKVDGAYKMWYSSVLTPAGGIGYATSPDGIAWTKFSQNPVISGGSGDWDDTVFAPNVIFDGCVYQVWYSGCNPSMGSCQVGYSRSLDGIHWNREGMVLPQGTGIDFDAGAVVYPTVMMGNAFYRLWYTGTDTAETSVRIGFAKAPVLHFDHVVYLPFLSK